MRGFFEIFKKNNIFWRDWAIGLGVFLVTGISVPMSQAAVFDISCGAVELINAINTANADAAADVINLTAACTITLMDVHNTTNGRNGLPSITTDITINGNGGIIERSSESECPFFRIFHIAAAGTLTLNNITLQNGENPQEEGAGIYNLGTLAINAATIKENHNVNYGGGGIYNAGTLTITNSTISDNTTEYGGGGLRLDSGTASITGSTISGNTAGNSGGGIGIQEGTGTLTLNGCTVTSNTAGSGGGGISGNEANGGSITISESTISGNTAATSGGGISLNYSQADSVTITDSTISGNTAASSGGGISHNNSATTVPLNITRCSFSNNTTGSGGGAIASVTNGSARLTIADSTFSGNSSANAGGGLNTDSLFTITGSTFVGNAAGTGGDSGGGGGINLPSGNANGTITNCTFSGSSALFYGGGVHNWGTVAVINCTFSGNSADDGGGVYGESEGASTTIVNTILAGSSTSGGNCGGSIIDGGSNLCDDGTCGFSGDNTDPKLDPAGLKDNGGPTQTVGLAADSPAIDGVSDCKGLTVDQRGMTRPAGTACDIGAFEVQPPQPPSATTLAATFVTPFSALLNGSVNANGNDATATFEYGLTTTYGTSVPAFPSPITGVTDTSVAASITGLTPDTTYHFRVVALNAAGTTYGLDMTFTTPSSPLTARSNSPIFEGMTLELHADLNLEPLAAAGAQNAVLPFDVNWAWIGPNGFTSIDQNPTIPSATTLAAGTYTVTVTPDSETRSPAVTVDQQPLPLLTATTEVIVLPNPVADSNGPICAGETLALTATTIAGATYAWTGPEGFYSALQNPAIDNATVQASGTYSVVATVGSVRSAPGNTDAVVNPIPETPVAGNNGPLSIGDDLALTASSVANATYAWTGPNGFSSTLQNPVISSATAAAAGTYQVTATVAGCPSLPGTTTVSFITIPAAPAAGNNGPICEGDTLELTASTIANATYAWTGPNGFSSTLQNPSIANVPDAAAGIYSVTATVGNVSSAPGTTTVVVNPLPVGCTVTAPSTVALGSTGNMASIWEGSTPGATYEWSVWVDGEKNNSLITDGQNSHKITWNAPAAFERIDIGVTVTTGAGCICDNDPPIYGQYPGNGVNITPQAVNIPTVSEWGMIIFSLLIAATAVVYMRRREESAF